MTVMYSLLGKAIKLLANNDLLTFSALTLTIQKIKPGDIPSFPEIIEDLRSLEGADSEQVR